MTDRTFKAGDKVETVHGEKLVVLKFQEDHATKKKGVVIKEGVKRILAESGGHMTWFPIEKIK